MLRLLFVGMCMVALTMGYSSAQDRFGGGSDRYMVSEVEGGVLRIDRQSGAVSMCEGKGGEWTCELVPDDRDAMLREIEDLRLENRRLRRQLARIDPDFDERNYGYGKPRRDRDGKFTKKEIDETMDSFEYMMERLLGTVEKFGLDGQPPR